MNRKHLFKHAGPNCEIVFLTTKINSEEKLKLRHRVCSNIKSKIHKKYIPLSPWVKLAKDTQSSLTLHLKELPSSRYLFCVNNNGSWAEVKIFSILIIKLWHVIPSRALVTSLCTVDFKKSRKFCKVGFLCNIILLFAYRYNIHNTLGDIANTLVILYWSQATLHHLRHWHYHYCCLSSPNNLVLLQWLQNIWIKKGRKYNPARGKTDNGILVVNSDKKSSFNSSS